MDWRRTLIWSLLLGLPLIAVFFTSPEIPKVIVAQIIIVVLIVDMVLHAKINWAKSGLWIGLVGVILLSAFAGFSLDALVGNGYRLQGVFLQVFAIGIRGAGSSGTSDEFSFFARSDAGDSADAAVPQPSALALLGLGIAGVAGWRRRHLPLLKRL